MSETSLADRIPGYQIVLIIGGSALLIFALIMVGVYCHYKDQIRHFMESTKFAFLKEALMFVFASVSTGLLIQVNGHLLIPPPSTSPSTVLYAWA